MYKEAVKGPETGILFLIFLMIFNASKVEAKERFFWGVANSAFQVEGYPANSDWYEWTHMKTKISDGTNADRATNFWNLYDEDFLLAEHLGVNSFRISIAWERVEPQPGVWDEQVISEYEKMIIDMRAHGLEPIITLQHFTLPIWLSKNGGLLAKEFSARFSEYSLKIVSRLARSPAKVKYWLTFNEPNVLALEGYILGVWPPGKVNQIGGFISAIDSLARAHVMVIKQFKDKNFDIKWGMALHWRVFQPVSKSLRDKLAAAALDKLFNKRFIERVSRVRGSYSFIGINYYSRSQVGFKFDSPYIWLSTGDLPKNDLGWEIYPAGLYESIKMVSHYKVPILITENGIADIDDTKRADFIKSHIDQIQRAISEGAHVLGYLYWSLTDNFEWTDGLTPRFGLVKINYQTLKREPRPSFNIYRSLIQTHTDASGAFR